MYMYYENGYQSKCSQDAPQNLDLCISFAKGYTGYHVYNNDLYTDTFITSHR